jgi:hypothetical protein
VYGVIPIPVAEATGYITFPLRGIEWRVIPDVEAKQGVSNHLPEKEAGLNSAIIIKSKRQTLRCLLLETKHDSASSGLTEVSRQPGYEMAIEYFSLLLLYPVSCIFNHVHFQIAATFRHTVGEFRP